MKVVTLINLGAATRVVHDAKHRPVVIETGERAEFITIDDKVFDILSRGQHNDTLIMIDPVKFELPEKMKIILDLIRRMDDGVDSELLRSYGKIFGVEESNKRPSRHVMLANLLKVSRNFCQFTLNRQRSSDYLVEGDPTRTEVTVDTISKPTPKPEPPVTPEPTRGTRRRHRR